jgi:hypothetical protein
MGSQMAALPDLLRPLFWDVELSTLDPERHRTLVIERAIELGNDGMISWLLRTYPAAAIAQVVRSSRSISANTACLWSLVLRIPKEEIWCLTRPSLLRPGRSSTA